MRPSKAQSPGISVSRIEPSGVFFSRFSESSSRSLGRCLLLVGRSRLNFLSHHIGTLFHQDGRNPRTELSRHGDNGDPRPGLPRVPAAHRYVKVAELSILTNRRPCRLDEFAPQPAISCTGDRSPIRPLSGGVLTWAQSQKSCKLAHVFKLPPIADTRQELTRHDPADPTNAHQILDALRQFRIVLTELANLLGRFHDLLLRKLNVVQQLIEFKAYTPGALQFSELSLNLQRPSTPGRCQWESDPFKEQQRLDPLLHPHHFTDESVSQLSKMAKLSVNRRRHVNTLQLSTAQVLREGSAVEAIRFDSLSWSSRNHRRCYHQALLLLSRQPIIQSIPGRSSLIDKRNLLIGKLLAHMMEQVLHTVRHVQRPHESLLVIAKRHRNAFLGYVQAGKHLVLLWYKCLLSHAQCLLAQCLW